MQALNYPAAAARGLKHFIEREKARDLTGKYAVDITCCQKLLELLQFPECQHFQLPEGGHIFNDNLKGIQGKPIRLPYRLISVSYFVKNEPHESHFDGVAMHYVPKRVIVAIEIPRTELVGGDESLFPGCERLCMVMALFCKEEIWTPCMALAILPSDKWDGTDYAHGKDDVFLREPGGAMFLGRIKIMLPTFYDRIVKAYGKSYASRSAYFDIGGEAATVLELCEALTCSNVHESTIQSANPNINERRERDGKLPLWETKTLTIDLPVTRSEDRPWRGGHHASPRLHLCRGHIRSLPGGDGNIWINDYARGDPTKGTINKTYKVRT